ncbi:methyl-accepting chemotaxis protein [Massilia sp. TS11]|uniref:methyl-accepting chemotaxis protein n=1 Tax=Massilia sp. TS11 TaxID=2908003 RepID=UPI001ED9DCD2|nr:methyl-accepting chemotaxis protein [Massilia sp. TS11]MCG2583594.1 methyl-accepting chemotaxis protein [Massilia sp. TS11]
MNTITATTDTAVPEFQQASRMMLIVIWGLFVLALGLSGMHDTLNWALLFGLPFAALPTILILRSPDAFLTHASVAFSLMAMTGLHIHQGGGVTELHFGVFVLLAFLVVYRDWRVILVGAGVVAVHHLCFNQLQELGYGVICFTAPSFMRVVVHALFVVVESAVLCYVSVLLKRDAERAIELRSRVAGLVGAQQGVIDLSAPASAPRSESGQLLEALIAQLRQAIGAVHDGAISIAHTADEVAAANMDLEQRTQRQAQTVMQSADAVEHMTESVRNNASHAEQANQLAGQATQAAQRGGAVVERVVSAMGAIDASSRRITDIITVIDGIAFQTNILALNAAVEAARAGEQGKGFAVVASEVRSLAQRSAAAAKDIKQLIETSVQNTTAGAGYVQEAGTTMAEIVDRTRAVAELMHDIAAASRAQSEGITHVDQALRALDDAAAENSALVEEGAAAAERLREQAQLLDQAVRMFRVGSGGAAPTLPRLAAR